MSKTNTRRFVGYYAAGFPMGAEQQARLRTARDEVKAREHAKQRRLQAQQKDSLDELAEWREYTRGVTKP